MNNHKTGGKYNREQDGMTYRQWLAGMALQGMLAKGSSIIWAEQIMDAKLAVKYADALIAELEKEQS